jgi:putative ABC transport system ATP-binding protein
LPLLSAVNLHKIYVTGEARVTALGGVSLALEPGEFVALMGPSGCGKSTLLHLCGAMDRPSSGTVTFEGRDLSSLSDDELTKVRRERIGFVFQFFNLLPTLTLADNIALPCLLSGLAGPEADRRAARLAERVDSDTTRSRSLVARCSGPRSRGRWSMTRASSSPTNRPAISTRTTAAWCSPCSPS